MMWVVLDVLHREIQVAFDHESELLPFSDEEHVVAALSDSGFCPAFEDEVLEVCRDVMKRWRTSPEDHA